MHITKGMPYRLIEIDGAIVLTHANQRIVEKSAVPLMQGTAGDVLTYLDRYIYERENGKTVRESHDAATRTAGLPTIPRPK